MAALRAHRLRGLQAVVVGLVLAVLAFPASARAEQFVLFDSSYVHELTGSHHHIDMAESVPSSWTTPVNFTNGKMAFRLQVKRKPNQTTPTTYTLCMSQGAGSTCGFIGRFDEEAVFTYTAKLPFSYVKNGFDWSKAKAPTDLRVVVKDTKNNNIDEGSSFDGAPDRTLYLPLEVRLTAWVVTSGAAVDMSDLPLDSTPGADDFDAGPGDAGARGPDDAGTHVGSGSDAGSDEVDNADSAAAAEPDGGAPIGAANGDGGASRAGSRGVTGSCSAASGHSSASRFGLALLALALLLRRRRARV